jgi:hypothetical protein
MESSVISNYKGGQLFVSAKQVRWANFTMLENGVSLTCEPDSHSLTEGFYVEPASGHIHGGEFFCFDADTATCLDKFLEGERKGDYRCDGGELAVLESSKP